MYKITRLRYLVDWAENTIQEFPRSREADTKESPIQSQPADRIVVSLDYTYIPSGVAPQIIKFDLENRSLLEILKSEYGKVPASDYQKIEIVYANEEESRLLSVTQLMPLVKKTGLIYGKNGELLQYLKAVKKKEWVTFAQHNPLIERKIGGANLGLPDASLHPAPKHDY